jgi:hypothetical protein
MVRPSPQDLAREQSRRSYVEAIRQLSDEELKWEVKILEHTPELREDLEAEMRSREKATAA